MKLNKSARKVLAATIPADDLLAVVGLSMNVGHASAHHDGTSTGSATVFSLPYARRHGIYLDSADLRHDLLNSIVTLTPRHLVFHSVNQLGLRPKPKDLIETVDRAGVRLDWFDNQGLATTERIFHFRFADGRQLLAAATYRSRLRKRPVSDEPGLLTGHLGTAATMVSP